MPARAGPAGSGVHRQNLWNIEGIIGKLFFFLIDQAGSNGFCFQSFNLNIFIPFLRLKCLVSIFSPPGWPERPASAADRSNWLDYGQLRTVDLEPPGNSL